MSINFEFNAPQFFNTSDDPGADKFFDVTEELPTMKVTDCSPEIKADDDQEVENQDPNSESQLSDSREMKKSPVPREVLNELVDQQNRIDENNVKQNASPVGNEMQLIEDLENLTLNKASTYRKTKIPLRTTQVFEGIKIERSVPKKHSMVTRLDALVKTPVLKLRSRPIPLINKSLELNSGLPEKEIVPRVRKSMGVKRRASPLSGERKFVSLAERIQHFHYDTPDRFRSVPKRQIIPQTIKPSQTIPKTPVLSAQYRQRPVNFPDEKEREEMELQEMKKHQVKAHPLNEKILKGPVLNLKAPVEKKPATVPEPFKLTETKKKEPQHSPLFVFKANPLPWTTRNGPIGIPPKKVAKATVPVTPKIRQPVRFIPNTNKTSVKLSKSEKLVNENIKSVLPLSFIHKIKQDIPKRDAVKKVAEEEKKTCNSFKAQPLPNYLRTGVKTLNNSQNKAETQKNKEPVASHGVGTSFKARPATVVQQKPFLPVLKSQASVLPWNVTLNTQKRAVERQKFDEKIKKKEEDQAQILKERKEEEQRLEQQRRLEERKLTEFKANPVPKYKPFEITPSDPSCLTLPITPRCFSTK